MKLCLSLVFLCLLIPVSLAGETTPAENISPPAISGQFDGADNYITNSDRYDGECSLVRYDCTPSYYWTVPGMAQYCFMRFTPTETDTSLATLYIALYQPQKVDTPSLDIFVCADDGTGFPDLDSIVFQATIPYGDLTWHPNFVTVDVSSENLSFHDDFHVGFTTNRTNAPQGVLAVTTDNGTCGTERSTIYRALGWQHLRNVAIADYNFLIRVSMCNFDLDSDGFLNDDDNCPETSNPGQEDADLDTIGDVCDNCPDSANTDQSDLDGDGFGDVCDNCPDSSNGAQTNSDADSYGDVCDNCPDDTNEDQADDDGDGIGNVCDSCPADPDNDIDADGYCADGDNCPVDYNPGQEDADGDGIGDLCDECTDIDQDGYGDPGFAATTCPLDNCPGIYNPDQEDADSDGIGDSCDTCYDSDGDGFGDPGHPENLCADDICPLVYNPDQADSDGDGMGDSCDVCMFDDENDIDGDGYCGDVDNCHKTFNPDQTDTDGDGIGNACETRDSVLIEIGRPGLPGSVDTLFSGLSYQFRLWLKNEVLLGAISLGFRAEWDSAVNLTWQPQPNGYGPDGIGTGLACVTVPTGCRMYPPDQVWDLGGFIVTEEDMDMVSPDTLLMAGASFNGRFYPGDLQHMISINFKVEVTDDSAHTLCIDSCFVPPGNNFVFYNFIGDQMDVELNRDLCWLVRKMCGDANGDDMLNVGDAVFIINYIFRNGPAPDPTSAGDENGDGEVNIGDAVFLINHIFRSGPSPVCT